jgi:hypothetical protein
MKRISVTGFAIVAALAFSLIGVASSSAAGDYTPERGKCKGVKEGGVYSEKSCQTLKGEPGGKGFIWVPNPAKAKPIKGTSGLAILRSKTPSGENLAAVECKSSTTVGTITGPFTSHSVTTYHECESAGEKCSSAGQAPGVIQTEKLEGTLGVINAEKDEVGEDIHAESGTLLAKFTCGVNKIETRGSVIGVETPVDLKTKVFTLTFSEEGSKQNPEKFEGLAKDTLETEINGLGGGTFPFPSTQTQTSKIEGAALEVRA